MNLKKEIKKLLDEYLEEHIDEFDYDDVRNIATNAISYWPD